MDREVVRWCGARRERRREGNTFVASTEKRAWLPAAHLKRLQPWAGEEEEREERGSDRG